MSRTRLFAALESEAAATPVDEQAFLDTSAEVAEAHEEVVDASTEVSELTDIVEDGANATDELAGYGEIMAEKVESGEGVSEDAAKVINVAIESIYLRLGATRAPTRMPSLEGFREPRSRPEATRLALEAGVVDTIKAIWAKIVEVCKGLWEKIKLFIANLMRNYDGLKKHLESLQKKVAALEGEADKKTLDKPGLARFFTGADGKANAASAMGALVVVDGFSTASKNVLDVVASVTSVFDFASIEKKSDEATSKIASAGQQILDGLTSGKMKALMKGTGKDGSATIGPIPGHYFIKIAIKEGKFSFDIEQGEESAKELTTLTKDEMAAMVTSAIAACEGGADFKNISAATEKSLKALSDAASKISKSVERLSKDKEVISNLRQMSSSATSLTNTVGKVAGRLPAIHFATIKHVADYVSVSISAYKKGEKKEEKK